MATAPPVVDLDALERRVASMERAAYGARLHEFPPYAGPQTPDGRANDDGGARARLLALERKVSSYEAMLSVSADDDGDGGGADAGTSFMPGDQCQARIIDADGVDRWHDAVVASVTGIGTRVRLPARSNKTETVPNDCLRTIPIDLPALDASLQQAHRELGATLHVGGAVPLSPLAKRILVGQREAELVQAADLVQQVRKLSLRPPRGRGPGPGAESRSGLDFSFAREGAWPKSGWLGGGGARARGDV